ncbi:hypothetical protein PoB_000623900 [Plakobranchus ocellatus]|uniref:Uncharacterized protein n=1 Tax=Plakobranchus ocellatus TaxID=259542 RepID=A0AAV3YCC6_9GAST|nr:hypothetical protein PoB_000623900 [Plakobranchus ocellatus]
MRQISHNRPTLIDTECVYGTFTLSSQGVFMRSSVALAYRAGAADSGFFRMGYQNQGLIKLCNDQESPRAKRSRKSRGDTVTSLHRVCTRLSRLARKRGKQEARD